jgi:L-threonylcarbamoyladenylate synthase
VSSKPESSVITERLNPYQISRAADLLRTGGTVAFPTETVYGLGANALDPAAITRIFEAKQRPSWDPLIVHISNREMLAHVAAASEIADALITAFWPGPLTLLLPRTTSVPDAVTAGRPLAGIRMPRHSLALALITAAGVPVAAPSANRFGHTSPTTAAHVLDDLDGRIDAVLNGGPTEVGVESTVFDPAAGIIYRPGAITAAMLADITGSSVQIYKEPQQSSTSESQPAPGVGMRHYAPRARLILVQDQDDLQERVTKFLGMGERVGVMLPSGWASPPGAVIFSWAGWRETDSLARSLFAGLRELDTTGVSVIVCPSPSSKGIGAAIRDRLDKAARRG